MNILLISGDMLILVRLYFKSIDFNLVYIFIPNHIINQHYRMVSLDSAIVYIIIWLAGGGGKILVRGLRGGGAKF